MNISQYFPNHFLLLGFILQISKSYMMLLKIQNHIFITISFCLETKLFNIPFHILHVNITFVRFRIVSATPIDIFLNKISCNGTAAIRQFRGLKILSFLQKGAIPPTPITRTHALQFDGFRSSEKNPKTLFKKKQ